MTTRSAAMSYGVSSRTVARWCDFHGLLHKRVGKRRVRVIDPKILREWIASNAERLYRCRQDFPVGKTQTPNPISLRMSRLKLAAGEMRPVNLRLVAEAEELIAGRWERLQAAITRRQSR